MEDLSLHILDIAENAVRANASLIIVEIVEDEESNRLTVCIKDDGEGMDEEMKKRVLDPFFTTKDRKKVGLGLALLAQSAQETGGDVTIDSAPGGGTEVTAVFVSDHPDMRPMGELSETMAALIAGNPDIRFVLDYRTAQGTYRFDSHETGRT